MKALFEVDKELKGSRRYACKDGKFPLQSVYVNRSYSDGIDDVAITIESEKEDKG